MELEKRMPVRHGSERRFRRQGRAKALRYALAIVAMVLAVNVFFEISNIQVEGNVVYSSGEVLAAAGLRTGKNIFLTRRSVVQARIQEALPCVIDTHVRFRLPDTLVLQVAETSAVAALPYEDGWLCLSPDLKVLQAGGEDIARGLIRLQGLTPQPVKLGETLAAYGADAGKISYLTELLTLLEERGMITEIQNMDIANASALWMDYDGRFSVRLGGQENLGYKLDFLREIAADLNNGETGVIDLSTTTEGHYIPS